MTLRDTAVVGLDSKRRPTFFLQRNDRLLNRHNVSSILGWRANVNFKPVMSEESAAQYVAKYATKAEKQAPAFSELLSDVAKAQDSGSTAVCLP